MWAGRKEKSQWAACLIILAITGSASHREQKRVGDSKENYFIFPYKWVYPREDK